MGDVLKFEIPLRWVRVTVKGACFDWHKSLPKTVRERDLISGPQVYRWLLRSNAGEIEWVYIGQSENFQKRISAHRGGAVLQERMRDCETKGGTVELEFLDLTEPLIVNGKCITNSALREHDVRLMMESIAVVTARTEQLRVLNRLQENVDVKRLISFATQNPEEIPRLLRELVRMTEQTAKK